VGADITPLQREGTGLHVKRMDVPPGALAPEYAGKMKINCCGAGKSKATVDGFFSAGGASNMIALFDRPVHPNVGRLWVNTLLTTEGQQALAISTDTQCSARTDLQQWCLKNLPEVIPADLLEEGKAYVTFHRISNVEYRVEAQNIARKVFGR
jgi:hypothetical protein